MANRNLITPIKSIGSYYREYMVSCRSQDHPCDCQIIVCTGLISHVHICCIQKHILVIGTHLSYYWGYYNLFRFKGQNFFPSNFYLKLVLASYICKQNRYLVAKNWRTSPDIIEGFMTQTHDADMWQVNPTLITLPDEIVTLIQSV